MTAPKRLPEGIRKTTAGKYQARYSVTRDGVTKQLSAGSYYTVAEAKAARQVALVQLREGGWVDPSGPRMTVERWVTDWVELTGATDKRTTSFLRNHILPHWGHRRLGEIEIADVQRWINTLHSGDLAPSTATAVYGTFKRIMARAVDYDKLNKTPCRLVRVPTAQRKERKPLSRNQIKKLENAIEPRYACMVHLAAWTGLRWQECAALHWEDVDLDNGVLHIHRAVKADGTLGTTKNGKSREVVMPRSVTDWLLLYKGGFPHERLVFSAPQGGHLNYSSFMTKIWRPAVARAGIPASGFHVLRHAYVGHMVASGLDSKVISEQVGHHSPAFTMHHYGWKRPDSAKVILAAVEKAQGKR